MKQVMLTFGQSEVMLTFGQLRLCSRLVKCVTSDVELCVFVDVEKWDCQRTKSPNLRT